jgi:hypothetical protein
VVVAKLVEKEDKEMSDKEEWEDGQKMVETTGQRIQFILLLSMVKLGNDCWLELEEKA